MSENNKKFVSKEEMALQRDYENKIKELIKKGGKTLYATVVTYGCQQNENDSERIRGMLVSSGYVITDDLNKADIIIYNTCAVRDHAEQKVFGNLGALKNLKRKKESLIIGVCGCMIQQKEVAEKIKKKYTHVDLIFGTHTLFELPRILFEKMSENKRRINILDIDGRIAEDIPTLRKGDVTAYISIMFGCNNFCSYCIVPYVRGRERSRKKEDILNEVKEVAKDGYKEIMLLGQNVNSYGNDLEEDIDFSDLLWLVSEVDGIERIRFMTSHPKDFNEKLMETIRDNKKVSKQLHLPIQAGSNDVLFKMNRKYTREDYIKKVEKMREMVPEITLTTDIIVGFPTETQKDFEDTITLLQKVRYDSIYSFIYSKRKGTPAAEMPMSLTDEEIHKNFDYLLEVQNEISKEKNDLCVGKVFKVIAESESKTDENMISGRTDGGKIVHFKGDKSLIGKTLDIKIKEAKTWFLTGEII